MTNRTVKRNKHHAGNVSYKLDFIEGMRDGLPIGLGYLAVAFALGITAMKVGIGPVSGFIASFFTLASAGEYAAFRVIGHNGTYIEMALIVLITNARYLLMSLSLAQKVHDDDVSIPKRVLVGMCVTDEIFAIQIRREGFLSPFYAYGAATVAAPLWASGTTLGIVAGELLPPVATSSLGVVLYAMFLAVIIPPARKSLVIASVVILSFLASFLSVKLSFFSGIPEGSRVIILTVIIASIFAILKPIKTD